jgi:transcriptional regulator with XRE-family HTH domain
MDDMNIAFINRQIVTWALGRKGLTPEQIATKAMTADKIRAWETGASLPTESQAELLAEKLQIPYLGTC